MEIQQPDELTVLCRNCVEEDDSDDHERDCSSYWVSISNYPDNPSCPNCGSKPAVKNPREVVRECENSDEDHEMFCCSCNTWMVYKGHSWICPNEKCHAEPVLTD